MQPNTLNPLCKCGRIKEINNGKRTSPFRSECSECDRKRNRDRYARKVRVRQFERMVRGW